MEIFVFYGLQRVFLDVGIFRMEKKKCFHGELKTVNYHMKLEGYNLDPTIYDWRVIGFWCLKNPTIAC